MNGLSARGGGGEIADGERDGEQHHVADDAADGDGEEDAPGRVARGVLTVSSVTWALAS